MIEIADIEKHLKNKWPKMHSLCKITRRGRGVVVSVHGICWYVCKHMPELRSWFFDWLESVWYEKCQNVVNNNHILNDFPHLSRHFETEIKCDIPSIKICAWFTAVRASADYEILSNLEKIMANTFEAHKVITAVLPQPIAEAFIEYF